MALELTQILTSLIQYVEVFSRFRFFIDESHPAFIAAIKCVLSNLQLL